MLSCGTAVLARWGGRARPARAGGGRGVRHRPERLRAEQVDGVTGLSTLVVIDPKRRGVAQAVRPQVKLLDPSGAEVKILAPTTR